MNKIEILDRSELKECWTCEGTGLKGSDKCKTCGGTGKFREPNYILVTEKDEQKIAFNMDFIK
jgi:DnaJ-class molecular chaperone